MEKKVKWVWVAAILAVVAILGSAAYVIYSNKEEVVEEEVVAEEVAEEVVVEEVVVEEVIEK